MKFTLLICLTLCLFNIINGQTFSVKGTVTDDKTQRPLKGAVVRIVGSDGLDAIVKTDSTGYYFFDSSKLKSNTSYIVSADASDQDYLASSAKANITTVGLTESKIFTADFQLRKGGVIVDRFFPLLRFYYEKADAVGSLPDSLNYIVRLLKDNPTIKIEADGHGSPDEKDAMPLSMERALVCKIYMFTQGIDSARIVAKGWGSTKPLEGCSKSDIRKMKTKEEKIQACEMDRRVEFRVLSFNYKPKDKQ